MEKFAINGIGLHSKEIYGVQRYTIELLKELDKIVEPEMLELVLPKGGARKYTFRNIIVTYLNNTYSNVFEKQYWKRIQFKNHLKKSGRIGIDLVLCFPNGCDIIAIHDCIIEHFPENADTLKRKLGRILYISKVKKQIQSAKKIITVSEYSKKEICNYYHCNSKKIAIIPNAWQHFLAIKEDSSIISKLGLTDREYFFSLGSRYAHKNFKWIKEAAKQNPGNVFVVSGSDQLNSSDSYLNTHKVSNLMFTGYLSDEEVKALMRSCKAFILPSLCEGFGIPPMEAMSVEADCIVSKASCLPEIYQDAVWYINPLQYKNIDLSNIMHTKRTMTNQNVLDRFSWEKSANKLYALLSELY